MKPQGAWLVATLLVLVCSLHVAAEPFRPSELLRALHRVQDEIARGDVSALEMQKLLTSQLTTILENPLDNRNPEASWSAIVIGFALDGANPKVARRLLAKISRDDPYHELGQAVSEFVNGNMASAAKLFDAVDVVKVEPKLAPYVAIAIGTANLESDINKAVGAFELATNLAPGTLVEEVSLRRLASLYRQTNALASYERTANLYLRRYSNSPFAGQFLAQLTTSIPAMLDLNQSKNMLAILSAKLDKRSLPLFLDVAEHSSRAGEIELVGHISDVYLESANLENQSFLARKQLYRLIAEPASGYSGASLEQAVQVAPDHLSPSERILLSKLHKAIREVLEPLGSANIGSLDATNLEPKEAIRQPSVHLSQNKALAAEPHGILAKPDNLMEAEIEKTKTGASLLLNEVDQLLAGADK